MAAGAVSDEHEDVSGGWDAGTGEGGWRVTVAARGAGGRGGRGERCGRGGRGRGENQVAAREGEAGTLGRGDKDSRRQRWTAGASDAFRRRVRARYERGEGGGVT